MTLFSGSTEPVPAGPEGHRPGSSRRATGDHRGRLGSARLRIAAVVVALLGTAVSVVPAQAAQAACPDGGYAGTPGQRIKTPTSGAIYMVDPEGRRRHIHASVYDRTFRSWGGIITRSDALCITPGPAFDTRSYLARDAQGAYYFVDQGVARWIVSGHVYDKYHFRWDTPVLVTSAWLYENHTDRNWT
jgi:hypothetical protein